MRLRKSLFSILPSDFHVPAIYYYMKINGLLEKELLFLEQILGRHDVAIDIGANEGVYTYRLSQLCKRVEAFEPQPECTALLRTYKKKNVRVHGCALSDVSGELDLHIPFLDGKPNSGYASVRLPESEHSTMRVPVRRLDDFHFESVSFIKIDVEGHEGKVLAGAQQTITRERPIMLVEIEQRHLGGVPMSVIFEQILQLSYSGFFLLNGILHPLSEFSFEKHQTKLGSYVNNFLFRPHS